MADPATNTTFPAELDLLPEIGPNDKENDPGVEHDVMHDRANALLNALQSIIGTTADDAAAASVLGRLLATKRRTVNIAMSDMSTALTTGAGKAVWVAPEAGQLTDLWVALGTALSSSGVVRIDANVAGASILTTRPSIDAGEPTSLTGTAAALSSATFAKGTIFVFDIDDAGTGAKGLQLMLEYTAA